MTKWLYNVVQLWWVTCPLYSHVANNPETWPNKKCKKLTIKNKSNNTQSGQRTVLIHYLHLSNTHYKSLLQSIHPHSLIFTVNRGERTQGENHFLPDSHTHTTTDDHCKWRKEEDDWLVWVTRDRIAEDLTTTQCQSQTHCSSYNRTGTHPLGQQEERNTRHICRRDVTVQTAVGRNMSTRERIHQKPYVYHASQRSADLGSATFPVLVILLIVI